jgi:hypothetical protein
MDIYQKPNQEDLRKLHQEVNQILNQRFLLTTVAIGVFGAMMAWAFPRGPVDHCSPVPVLTYLVCISLLVVLSTLLALHFFLKQFLRVLTAYLTETSESIWEIHWAKWRDDGKWYVGYSRPQTAVFAGLGLLGLLFPFFIALAYDLHQNVGWMIANVAFASLYVMAAIWLGFRDVSLRREENYQKDWKEVLGIKATVESETPQT